MQWRLFTATVRIGNVRNHECWDVGGGLTSFACNLDTGRRHEIVTELAEDAAVDATISISSNRRSRRGR
eukprot:scaffold229468_cov36-Cyclotella_meneghiniana.AAC.4